MIEKPISSIRGIVRIGIKSDLNRFDLRCLRITNLGALIGSFVMAMQGVIAFTMGGNAFGFINFVAALMFLGVLILNSQLKYTLAAIWLLLNAYIQILLGLYLFGFNSGGNLFFSVLIFGPFMIFPRRNKIWVVLFSLSSVIIWISITIFQDRFPGQIPVPDFIQYVNTGAVAIACLLMVLVFYTAIQVAEDGLVMEREKSDYLLHNILPMPIANRLKKNEDNIADAFGHVSVLFADIVGFTEMSSRLPAKQIVEHLNEIFTHFDGLVEKYDVEKIKTIGDAYMVCAGLPKPDLRHQEKVADLALDMLHYIREGNLKNINDLEIRLGIHSGPVIAGVIGQKKFVYDVWGDTVNVANRLESSGVPGRIQVSGEFKNSLEAKFIFEDRGLIEIRGKGMIKTYFLNDRI